jgi:hypothetical protein
VQLLRQEGGKGIVPYKEYILIFSGIEKEKRARIGVGFLIHKKYENASKLY